LETHAPRPTKPASSSFLGSHGFLFTTASTLRFSPILHRLSYVFNTSSLNFSLVNPLLGVFYANPNAPRFIVVGGVRFIGNLVDIEDHLSVEIHDPQLNSWEICPLLPADFRSGNSWLSLSSALFGGKFYVLGIYSCFISSFDLEKRVWNLVQTLRPPGVIFSFLISCQDRLVLAGTCNSSLGPSFNLWRIDERTMEFSEIAIMPQDLLYSLFDSDEDDKFASLKCVGLVILSMFLTKSTININVSEQFLYFLFFFLQFFLILFQLGIKAKLVFKPYFCH
jgi:hypothetical protein